MTLFLPSDDRAKYIPETAVGAIKSPCVPDSHLRTNSAVSLASHSVKSPAVNPALP